jgi:AraC-like DNA-binding protein
VGLEQDFFDQLGPGLVAADLLDAVPDVVFFVKDRDGRYMSVSQTLAARCGFANKADILGRTAADLFPRPLGQRYLEQDLYVARTGTAISDRLELHLYPDRKEGWCLTNKIPVRDRGGSICGMAGISRDLHVSTERGKHYEELAAAIDHIHAHYGDPLRLPELAQLASLSVYQFEQRIKKIFGLTVGQFISKTRIKEASRLLRDTTLSIAGIALECGYCDQSAFARQFKTMTALTPTEYRQTISERGITDV